VVLWLLQHTGQIPQIVQNQPIVVSQLGDRPWVVGASMYMMLIPSSSQGLILVNSIMPLGSSVLRRSLKCSVHLSAIEQPYP